MIVQLENNKEASIANKERLLSRAINTIEREHVLLRRNYRARERVSQRMMRPRCRAGVGLTNHTNNKGTTSYKN